MDLGLYIAAVGGSMSERRLDDVAHNLANIATPGFKAGRTAFSTYFVRALGGVGAAYPSVDRQAFDLHEGPIRFTGRPLDLALEGPGFFVVRGPQNKLALVRTGAPRTSRTG